MEIDNSNFDSCKTCARDFTITYYYYSLSFTASLYMNIPPI